MKVETERVALDVEGQVVETVTAVVHRPARPTGPALLMSHGAGGDLDSEGLVALCDGVAALGTLAVRANLPYRERGRGGPPRADRAIEQYGAVLDAARRAFGPRRRWVVGGKSYSGRVASLAAAAGLDVTGLVFYGYPLHPPGKPEALRVDHWADIAVPCLFLQGSGDTFGGADEVAAHLHRLGGEATLHPVQGGDHSLKVAKKASSDGRVHHPGEVLADVSPLVADWVRTVATGT